MTNSVDPKRTSSALKRLSDDETKMLISLVQRRPCLWNENHSDFKNTLLRKKLWSEMGTRLNISGVEAKCKWKNLKDKFRKVRNIQEGKSGSATASTTPKWRFYNAMLFSKDMIPDQANGVPNNTPSVINDVPSASDDSSSEGSDSDNDTEDTMEKTLTRESQSTSPTSQIRSIRFCGRGTKRKKTGSEDPSKTLPFEEKRTTSSSAGQENKKGDDYHFLMSLLPYIEALDPLEKLELRSGIQKLVTDSYKRHVSKKGFRLRQDCGNQ